MEDSHKCNVELNEKDKVEYTNYHPVYRVQNQAKLHYITYRLHIWVN